MPEPTWTAQRWQSGHDGGGCPGIYADGSASVESYENACASCRAFHDRIVNLRSARAMARPDSGPGNSNTTT